MRKTLLCAVLSVAVATSAVPVNAGATPAPPPSSSNGSDDAIIAAAVIIAIGAWIFGTQGTRARGKAQTKTKKTANSEY